MVAIATPTYTRDALDNLFDRLSMQAIVEKPSRKEPPWSKDEIAFLRENAGKMADDEIALALGRTENAIKVFRVRQGLRCITRAGTIWVTANKAAHMLGIDSHKIVYWCRMGLIPATVHIHVESGREYWRIRRVTLYRWCISTDNWVYINWRIIKEPTLRQLCELRAARWEDEWWTTNQVAAYHGVDVKDVTRLISHGRIQGFCPPFSLGGRDFGNTWRFWFVKKSEATRPDLIFYRRKGRPGISRVFTPSADAWILRAHDELGLGWSAIARTMSNRHRRAKALKGVQIWYRYRCLQALLISF